MKRIKKPPGDEEHKAILACLAIIEEKEEALKSCLKGRQFQRSNLVQHIEQAKLKDAEMLAAIDKDIADFTAQIEQLEVAAAKFRLEMG